MQGFDVNSAESILDWGFWNLDSAKGTKAVGADGWILSEGGTPTSCGFDCVGSEDRGGLWETAEAVGTAAGGSGSPR
jgi:hypothetical protein